MKKVTPKGDLIKELRMLREKGSLQKEMSHALGISERHLRLIENNNSPISIATLDRIATYLGVPQDHVAYAIDAPKLVPTGNDTAQRLLRELSQDSIIPRFDTDIAYATMDEARLIHDVENSEDITIQIEVKLTDTTSVYTEELVRLLTPLTWSKRDWLAKPIPVDEIVLHRRVRQLLVLLKGNDVWLYYTHHLRRLPERVDLPKEDEPHETKFRVAIVFGPPGKYGEESIDVKVDNGQPYFLKGWENIKLGGD
jgi:transcriptional regulator with XRE-family HTH domain